MVNAGNVLVGGDLAADPSIPVAGDLPDGPRGTPVYRLQ
jgi:hypothetical protein